MIFFRLIVTNLRRHRIRSLISVAGIAFSVAAMLTVVTILQGAIGMFSAILSSDSQIIVFERNVSDLFFSSVPAAAAEQIAGWPMVSHADPVLFGVVSSASHPIITCFGVTAASQLESSLTIVAILLMLPFGLTRRKAGQSKLIAIAWAILAAEFILCFALGRADISHHRPAQFLSLGSLLMWIPLMPAYYAAFEWHANTRRWRIAFLAWWSALVLTGWVFFLPGVLDHFKFTDGLVGHSLLAMAGFTSSLLIFVLVQLLGEGGWIFNQTRSFYGWNIAVLVYVVLMSAAGWREGFDPTFTIVPGTMRNTIYILRLVVGIVMLAASLDWLIDASTLLREPALLPAEQEAAA